MKIKPNLIRLARVALVAGAAALSVPSASAVLTTASSGDLFIGFRQTSASNTLSVNLGSVTQFLTSAYGGTATAGSTLNVQFGLIPSTIGTTNEAVFDLKTDLTAVFGASWANNLTDGTGVRWAVAGFTDNFADNTPIAGYNARTIFVTKARTTPAVQSATLVGTVSNATFSGNFASFVGALGGGSYINQGSTVNSSVAYVGAKGDANNWNTKIGANGSFGLGAIRTLEQATSGAFSGPTDSVLDLYLAPTSGSTLTTTRTYLGNFSLNNAGELSFTAVPEPSTYALLALSGTVFMVFVRRRKRDFASLN